MKKARRKCGGPWQFDEVSAGVLDQTGKHFAILASGSFVERPRLVEVSPWLYPRLDSSGHPSELFRGEIEARPMPAERFLGK
jgi:hypothetical protein